MIEANSIKPNAMPGVDVSNEIDETNQKWTNVQVDSQILSSFMACPRKYHYVFMRRLNPLGGISDSITRGSIVHDGILEYWTEIIKTGDYQQGARACIDKVREKLAKQLTMDNDFKLETMQGVIDFLKHLQSFSWIPLAAEKYFRIKVYEDASTKLRIFLTGKIDLIVKTHNIAALPIDNKTEAERWFHTQMSNQFKIYCIATGSNLLGVQRIGFQKTLEPKDKFALEMMPFDADVLEEWRTETLPYWVKQMLIAYSDNFFPMNTTNCVHGHFKCQFSEGNDTKGICNVSREVREQKLGRYFVIGDEWDPSKV